MQRKKIDFAQMKVFDFDTLNATLTDNCFACDSCNCDVGSGRQCDADWVSITLPKQEKMVQQLAKLENIKTDQIAQTIKSHSL